MKTPISTYRIQFQKEFPFEKARQIVDYLHDLGIRTLYASPIFKAASGSTHGYDVADPNQINPEMGAQEQWEILFSELTDKGITWLQDIVPNHMVFSSENALLMDVLEKGYASKYSKHFDIEWNHPNETLKQRVLVPFLGSPYHETLQNRELQLQYADGALKAKYYDWELPLRIESYSILFPNGTEVEAEVGGSRAGQGELAGLTSELVQQFAQIASRSGDERIAEIEKTKKVIWDTYMNNTAFREAVDQQLEKINGNPEQLHLLLSKQHFRLAYWKMANREINYRRFFNINALISIRVEDPDVFEQTHQLIFNLLGREGFSGVRIDHIDGLNDPSTYLRLLRERSQDSYIVVEKILETGEDLPDYWPIEGTSGYDFMDFVNNVFCEQANKEIFNQLYSRFTGNTEKLEELLYEKKKFILDRAFVGDLERLFTLFRKLTNLLPEGPDVSQADLRTSLRVLLSCFPVYRTYVNSPEISSRDQAYMEEALAEAQKRLPDLTIAHAFLRKILLMQMPEHLTQPQRANWIRAVMKFQQITSPLMAKGLEDTAFYIYNRLVSLNEVGGNPDVFGISTEKFHEFNQHQLQQWPHKMNATATHDTKRGEDMRARLNVLSEIPGEWEERVLRWHEINTKAKQKVKGEYFPDKNEEYFLYQTLIGAWPFEDPLPENFSQRMEEYIIKAMKEAKVHTSWTIPDEGFEEALLNFTRKLLDPSHGFMNSFAPFAKKIAHYGIFNSLSQTLLKITSPGIPDIYQGCELWDLSLVDPDNRRPVDYDLRKRYLKEIREVDEAQTESFVSQLLDAKEDGRVKLFTVFRALQLRNQLPKLFAEGEYIPLTVSGRFTRNVVAFARVHEGQAVITVAPRFYTQLIAEGDLPIGEKVWQDTIIRLPESISGRSWQNVFTDSTLEIDGNVIPLAAICNHFPVGLLRSAE